MAYYSPKTGPYLAVWAAVLMLMTAHAGLGGTRLVPPVTKQKQAADRLVAMTKAGYYSARLVNDRQTKWLPGARVRDASAQCSGVCFITTPMPVRLINFSGQRLDTTQVQLNWTTSAEINNDYFAIQRSANPAAGFETIGSVKGKGTSAQNVNYQFVDPNTSTGYTYYRLKQVDLDGSYTYSQIIAVKGAVSVLAVTVFPNPGEARQINFRISGVGMEENVSITLYDQQGRLLHQEPNARLDADQGLSIPAALTLAPGTYFVRVSAKNQQAAKSFIVRP